MGKITTTLTITNHADEVLAQRGLLPTDQVRRVELTDVLVDTGTTHLCLPLETVEQLGLTPLREIGLTLASGFARANLYEDAKISLLGRSSTFECIGLPDSDHGLLGVVPLEAMGIEPDLQNQKLKLLPMEGKGSYLLAVSPQIYRAPSVTISDDENNRA